jgi:hypothetical protein
MAKTQEVVDELEDLSWDYVLECLSNTKPIYKSIGATHFLYFKK